VKTQALNPAVPITYARDNIIFAGEQASAVYRLQTHAYPMLPDGAKWQLAHALGEVAQRVEADISIYRVTRSWPASEYVQRAEGMLDARHQHNPDRWTDFLRGHERRLDQLNPSRPEVYLRVSLPPLGRQGLRHTLDRAYRRSTGALAVGPEAPIMEREIVERLEQDARTLDRVREYQPGARRITPAELQWLCLRAPVRHVAEPCLDQWFAPNAMVIDSDDGLVFTPCESDFLRLFNAPITRETDYVVVDGVGPDGRTVRTLQTFLGLGQLPHRVLFPGDGAELMFGPLDGLPFDVDAVFHAKYLDNRKAISDVDKAIRDAKTRLEEETEAEGDPDERAWEIPDELRALKTELTGRDRPPLVLGGVTYALGVHERIYADPDEAREARKAAVAELDRRVDLLRGRFPDMQVNRPPGLHERMYHDHLLQPTGGQLPDYRELMRKIEVGMLMPIAGSDVGSERGPYIGYTICGNGARMGTPVLFDFLEAARSNETPNILMAGRTGSGKTLTAMFLALLAALRGSYVFTMDPSPDHHLVDLPELEGETQTIGLEGSEEYRGKLDPITCTPEELRRDIALSYYLGVLPEDPMRGRWSIAITRALRAVLSRQRAGEVVGSLHMLEHLRNPIDPQTGETLDDPHSRDVAEALTLISEEGLGILAFGDGTGIRGLGDVKRITTVVMGNLALPDKEVAREHYSDSQRHAVATFELVGAYLMWLVKQADRSVHKIIPLDEAWRWLQTSDGRHRLNELLRLARKFNCTVIVLSQGVTDIGDLVKHFRYFFLYGLNGVEEARAGLAMLGCDPGDDVMATRLATQEDFKEGLCLFRDGHGRVAEMQIDVTYPHILRILNTNPDRDRQAAEEVAA
jgi:hypothetical protein